MTAQDSLVPPPIPANAGLPDSPVAAAAEVRAAPPVLVSSMQAATRARLVKVDDHALVAEVAAFLSATQVSLVVVCDAAGAAVGVVTETVLIRRLAFGNADMFNTQASEVMLRDFHTCRSGDSLTEVVAKMQAQRLAHVLVIEDLCQPVGVLTVHDGLRALLAAGNYEEALLRNYVMGVGYQ